MKTILRSELDNENELTSKQVREYYVRSQVNAVTDIEYIKDTALDFCKKQNLEVGDGEVHRLFFRTHPLMRSLRSSMTPLSSGWTTTTGYDYKKDFEERFKPRFRNPVSTGWELIDDICKGG